MAGARHVFLGTSEFAVRVLSALAEGERAPVLVVTPPDRPKGRGRRTSPAPAALAAERLGIPVLRTPNVNEAAAREAIAGHDPALLTTAAFGQIIREELLDAHPMLNVHPSLLPRWRGAAPIERALMAGDQRTGVCVMRVERELDAGPVAVCEEIEISPEDDHDTLEARLADLGGRLLAQALGRFEAGELSLSPQPGEGATYAEKIEPGERRLDPDRTAAELDRVVRALSPHIGAHVELPDGSRLGVARARPEPGEPGRGRLAVDGGGLVLGCAEGSLRLLAVKPAGGRVMDAAAYVRGHGAHLERI